MHWADVEQSDDVPDYIRDVVRQRGNFSVAVAPLVWDGRGIGTIDVMRKPPRAYSEKELALLATFADQAVIAIQNARLFNETKEALERQTATGEILASMSGSMTDAQPVFDTIARSLLRLFRTEFAMVGLAATARWKPRDCRACRASKGLRRITRCRSTTRPTSARPS